MKRYLLIMLFACLSVCSFADVYKYQATEFAFRSVNNRGYWTDWSDWEKCSILVVINTNSEKVDIYSATQQQYDIISYDGQETDGQGGTQFQLGCVDANGIRCNIRQRTQKDGQMQLYVDYADASWVYNIRQK